MYRRIFVCLCQGRALGDRRDETLEEVFHMEYSTSERLDNKHAHARTHTHAHARTRTHTERHTDRQTRTQVFKVRETAERELKVAQDRIRALEHALHATRQVEKLVLRASARESVCFVGAVGEERASQCT